MIEGVGDHGCEYMTGGRVIILGRTGKNFAAGMSGGIAYVFDETGDFPERCNQQMVSLAGFADEAETEFVKDLVFRHFELTGSNRAEEILGNWEANLPRFVRVIPNDYQRVIESQKAFISEGLSKRRSRTSGILQKRDGLISDWSASVPLAMSAIARTSD